ncbi:hypothetical protein, partial [Arthrobacter sp. H41]
MTQQLYPDTTISPEISGPAAPPVAGFSGETLLDVDVFRSRRGERESVWLERALAIEDFSQTSMRELRVLANQLYRLI